MSHPWPGAMTRGTVFLLSVLPLAALPGTARAGNVFERYHDFPKGYTESEVYADASGSTSYKPSIPDFTGHTSGRGAHLDNATLHSSLNWTDDKGTTLAQEGRTTYVIACAADAAVPEKKAAAELADYLKQITGAEFAIVVPEQVQGRPVIAVGPDAAALVAPDLKFEKSTLGDDGIVLRTCQSNLVLAGARGARRGTLYAVYEFLERSCGVRWWTSRETHVPTSATLVIPPLDTRYVPKLAYRETWYRDAFNGVFAAHSRCNGHFEKVPPEYGGHYSILGWCHTFNQLIPPAKYFKEHPEWFSEINGRRVDEGAQLCLTNEEVRKELTKNALAWIRKDPDAGMISIAQNDCGGACQCAACRAVEVREGAASGLLLEFVNKVAEDIEKEYPGFIIETLAYQYTRKPPKSVRPRNNVIIRLCSIECSFAQTLATGAQNEAFRKDIEGWSAIAPRLFIWDYVTNFSNYVLPHPNLHVLAPNIRFFVDNKCAGLFEQGDGGSSCGDFVALRAWLLSHLMWDPTRDENALVKEFMDGYYGAAATPLQQVLALTREAIERSGKYLRCYMADTSAWMTLEDLNRSTQLFDEAARLVKDDPTLHTRVRQARMSLDYAWLQRYHALKRVAKTQGKPFLGPTDPAAFCNEFIKSAREFNLGQYAEGRTFASLEPGLARRFGPPSPPPAMCAGVPEEDWVDAQDGEFVLYGPGTWAALVDDPKASDGRAARMPGNHKQWAVQFPVSADATGSGPWHCYVVVRCQVHAGGATSGVAYQLGIYDTEGKEAVAAVDETLEHAAAGEYRTVDLGVHELKDGMYVWVAPVANPEAVDAVFVDRMVFVKGKSSPPKPSGGQR